MSLTKQEYKKLDKLIDEDKYEEILKFIEKLPSHKMNIGLHVIYGKTINNIAMYEFSEEDPERIEYIKKAIDYLERHQEEGLEDFDWNFRCAMAYYSLGHSDNKNDLEWYFRALYYFNRSNELFELDKEDKKEVEFFVSECKYNIVICCMYEKKYVTAFNLFPEIADKQIQNFYDENFIIDEFIELIDHNIGIKAKKLPKKLSDKLAFKYYETNNLLKNKDLVAAVDKMNEIILAIPSPNDNYDITSKIEMLMGTTLFLAEYYQLALIVFKGAISSREASYSYIMLRIGSCLYEIGQKDLAYEFLNFVLQMEGERYFELDQKYLKFLKERR